VIVKGAANRHIDGDLGVHKSIVARMFAESEGKINGSKNTIVVAGLVTGR
jgi:hypothetical protein